jgi:hypothetical protein
VTTPTPPGPVYDNSLLTHIEFESSPRTDLAHRMLEYRAGIMRRHPRHRITQHIIVLGPDRPRRSSRIQ